MKNYSFALLLILFISSCCHNVNTACMPGNLGIYVSGFTESDLSTSPLSATPPYAIRYVQDNAFDIAIDTLMIGHNTDGNDTFFFIFNDPTRVNTGVDDSLRNGLIPGYDYKIFIPADSLVYSLTNLTAMNNKQMELQKCGDKTPPTCYENAVSCTINGVNMATKITPGGNNSSNSNFYSVPATFIFLSK